MKNLVIYPGLWLQKYFSASTIIQVKRPNVFKTMWGWRGFATKCNSSIISAADEGTLEKQSPLKGIRVLDLSRILAGPFCTMLLGDLGAEIIKVEKPGVGDESRKWVPPQTSTGMSCYFVSVNRNKQSITIDLKRGKDLVQKLAAESDILVENFVPGTMEKLGLGYEDLRTINPRLIYCTVSGYGSTGPLATRGGYDVIAASTGGLLHITGPRDGEPCKVGVAMTDLATGLYLHGAIMAALLQRQGTNKGQRIETNLLSTQVSCLVNLASNYLNGGIEARKLGTEHESIVPYESFRTKDDRWITIGAGSDELFRELCRKADMSHLTENKKYSTNALRVEHRVELIAIIREHILSKTCAEWLEMFKDSKFPFGPVNNMQQVFSDPQVMENNLVEELGPYKVVGPAVKFSMAENRVRFPPPELGQHTRQVLRNVLRLTEPEIDDLYNKSILG